MAQMLTFYKYYAAFCQNLIFTCLNFEQFISKAVRRVEERSRLQMVRSSCYQ